MVSFFRKKVRHPKAPPAEGERAELSREDRIIEKLADFSGVTGRAGLTAGVIGLTLAILGGVIVYLSRLLAHNSSEGYLVGGIVIALTSIGIVGLYVFWVDYEAEKAYRGLVTELTSPALRRPVTPPKSPPDPKSSDGWTDFFQNQLDSWSKSLQALVSVAGLAPLSTLIQPNVSGQQWYVLIPIVIILIIVAIVTPTLWYLPRIVRGRKAVTCLMVLTISGELPTDESIGRAYLRITSP